MLCFDMHHILFWTLAFFDVRHLRVKDISGSCRYHLDGLRLGFPPLQLGAFVKSIFIHLFCLLQESSGRLTETQRK